MILLLLSCCAEAAEERVLRQEVIVNAGPEDAWRAVTTSEGLQTWAAPVVEFELRTGGKFHSNYRPGSRIGDPGTIYNTVLSYLPLKMLSFQIGLTDQFPEGPRKAGTLMAVVQFEPMGERRTKVVLSMAGFGTGPEWDKVYNFFAANNPSSLAMLQQSLGAAPSDDRAADRAAIRSHIEKIFQAFIDVDPATVRATHAPNWLGFTQTARSIVHSIDGYMDNVWIGRVKGPADVLPDALVIVDYKIPEMEFEFYGDVALVAYIADIHVSRKARIPARLRSLDVYAKVGGAWTQVGSNIDLHPET